VSTSDGFTSALSNGLSDLLHFRAGDQEGNVKTVVAKGRVGSNVDTLLLAVLNKVVALQDGVTLNLVGGGNNTGAVNNGLELWESQYGCRVYRRWVG
jgi:hypothetical protein